MWEVRDLQYIYNKKYKLYKKHFFHVFFRDVSQLFVVSFENLSIELKPQRLRTPFTHYLIIYFRPLIN